MSKVVESAVSFAASMIRKGDYVGRALSVAAGYYKVPYEEVQRGLAARSGRSQAGRKKATRPERRCEICGKPAGRKATIRVGYAGPWYAFTCTDCGDTLPPAFDGERDLSVKWTRYTPSKAVQS